MSTSVSINSTDIVEAVTEAVWEQWESLGAHTGSRSDRPLRFVIDPEALLLTSFYAERFEMRLRDFAIWCARSHSSLYSVQRAKTLAKRFPDLEEGLSAFAHHADEAGDSRWTQFIRSQTVREAQPSRNDRLRGPKEARVHPPSTLVYRLRSGFGVNAKPDILAFLYSFGSRGASRRETAEAVGYSRATVRSALADLVRAKFVLRIDGRPTTYTVRRDLWRPILEMETLDVQTLSWVFWADLFPFLISAMEDVIESSKSEYLQSRRARDLTNGIYSILQRLDIYAPDPAESIGTDYLDAFSETIKLVLEWIKNQR